MWNFVQIPRLPRPSLWGRLSLSLGLSRVPVQSSEHVVMEEYRVHENQVLTPKSIIAIVSSVETTYAIRVCRRARVRKTFFEPGSAIPIGDPIALLTIYDDLEDNLPPIEYITIECSGNGLVRSEAYPIGGSLTWSFVRLPPLPNKPERYVALMEEYLVQEGQELAPNGIIAIMRAVETTYAIRVTRRAIVRKTFFDPSSWVRIGDPIALLGLYDAAEDNLPPIECITIEQ